MSEQTSVNIGHLYSSALAEMTVVRSQLRRILLDTGGMIIRAGCLCDLVAKHLGAGVYRLTAKERL